jgi:hypothetical protein
MIISKQKKFKEILGFLNEKEIFIIGCGKCAKKLHVGGEPEVLEMMKKLTAEGKNITGWTVLSSACSLKSWEEILSENPGIQKAGALLVLSCGSGVSVVSKLADIIVYPALDTESVGGVCCGKTVRELCGMCGECNVWEFGGVCPVSKCPKGLLNGPCGGAKEGKCEVDDRDCIWELILERLQELGKQKNLLIIKKPKDHMKKLWRKA